VFFLIFATGERDTRKDPVSRANVFHTINMSLLVFLPIVGTTLVPLKGSFRRKPLVLSLIAESSRLALMSGWPLLRPSDVLLTLECEKVA